MSHTIETYKQIVNIINEAREVALFYLNKYRFDPFMEEVHNKQLEKINKLIKELEEE